MAKPIPAVEPVTSAFLFASCKSIGASLDDPAFAVANRIVLLSAPTSVLSIYPHETGSTGREGRKTTAGSVTVE